MNTVVLTLSDEEKCYLFYTLKKEIEELSSVYKLVGNGFTDKGVFVACQHVNSKIICLSNILNKVQCSAERM